MRLVICTTLAAALLFSVPSWAGQVGDDNVLDAKIESPSPRSQLDTCDSTGRAEALLDEAEFAIQIAQLERDKADEQDRTEGAAMRSLSAAEEQWREPLRALEAQATRLGRAEMRLQEAEGILNHASAAMCTSMR